MPQDTPSAQSIESGSPMTRNLPTQINPDIELLRVLGQVAVRPTVGGKTNRLPELIAAVDSAQDAKVSGEPQPHQVPDSLLVVPLVVAVGGALTLAALLPEHLVLSWVWFGLIVAGWAVAVGVRSQRAYARSRARRRSEAF